MDLHTITLSSLADYTNTDGAKAGDVVIFENKYAEASPAGFGPTIEAAMEMAKDAAKDAGVGLDTLLGQVYRVVADPPPPLHTRQKITYNFARIRVPGGWLYERTEDGGLEGNRVPNIALCFVPDTGEGA
jgi:hypothetical protein